MKKHYANRGSKRTGAMRKFVIFIKDKLDI